jgi:hypothetical protein
MGYSAPEEQDFRIRRRIMKSTTRLISEFVIITGILVLGLWFLAVPPAAMAQSQGNNAIYYQPGSSGVCCQGSGAFIDASQFVAHATDICGVIYYIFTHGYPSTFGTVVDARGLNSSIPGFSMTCAATTSPWTNGSTIVSVPSTILLPAGTVFIQAPWILPHDTHLIGVGDGLSGTVIEVLSGTTLGSMIQFGSSATNVCNTSGICTGISVENLTLNGQAQSIDGIINQYAQNNS